MLQVQDLSYLVRSMGDDAFSKRYQKLSQGLCEVTLLSWTMYAHSCRQGVTQDCGASMDTDTHIHCLQHVVHTAQTGRCHKPGWSASGAGLPPSQSLAHMQQQIATQCQAILMQLCFATCGLVRLILLSHACGLHACMLAANTQQAVCAGG